MPRCKQHGQNRKAADLQNGSAPLREFRVIADFHDLRGMAQGMSRHQQQASVGIYGAGNGVQHFARVEVGGRLGNEGEGSLAAFEKSPPRLLQARKASFRNYRAGRRELSRAVGRPRDVGAIPVWRRWLLGPRYLRALDHREHLALRHGHVLHALENATRFGRRLKRGLGIRQTLDGGQQRLLAGQKLLLHGCEFRTCHNPAPARCP